MGRRWAVPLKITSAISEPRSIEGRCSPSTQARLSEMFDFPQPFGPTTAVMPPGKLSFWASAKDLKPWSSREIRRTGGALRRGWLGTSAPIISHLRGLLPGGAQGPLWNRPEAR